MNGSIDDLNGWLIQAGLDGLDQAGLVAGYCERLVEVGLPVWRASVGADTLPAD
jgi:adenylate cyclase